ncbi:hypothetical protein [Viridibacillus arvi]|uniref:hypothetical protein n=1 Tax=Viridibacillus arvi TaxID=263475 RepID=UPI003D29BA04
MQYIYGYDEFSSNPNSQEVGIIKLIKLAFTGFLVIGLLMGCAKESKSQPKEETSQPKKEIKDEQPKVNDSKLWKDVSTPEGFNNYRIKPTLNAWVTFHAEDVAKTDDVIEYLPKITSLTFENDKYFKIQGEDFQKDFDNLHLLAAMINHCVYVISVQDKQGIGTAETYDQLNESYKYFTELLHDIDVVINYDGKGETFGVTHQLDGKKVDKLESFIQVPK